MGQELTIQLVSKGARVAMVDISREGLSETEKLIDSDVCTKHLLDITDHDAVMAFKEQVILSHQAVDGLINNAGIIQPFVNVNDLDSATISRVMNINFFGMVNMTKALLPHLLTRPVAHIANVSSMGGFIPFPGQTVYSASKAAVKLFTEGLYAELKNSPVGVTVIHPGAVNTHIMVNSGLKTEEEMAQQEKSSSAKMISAQKAAEIMINGIERNKFRVLVGSDAGLLDKLYRINPKFAVNLIVKKMSNLIT